MKRVIVASLLVLFLSAPSMALVAQVFDYEVGTLGTALGIDQQTPAPDAMKLKVGAAEYSNIGVTSGALSLKVWDTGAAANERVLAKGLWRNWEDWKVATAVKMDITVQSSDILDGWIGFDVELNGGVGTHFLAGTTINSIPSQLTTYTLMFSIPQIVRDKANGGASNWGDIFIRKSHGEQGAAFYIDNVQLIPEPATMVLLGLGGLMSLKRRRA
jgi:hypothetical protein